MTPSRRSGPSPHSRSSSGGRPARSTPPARRLDDASVRLIVYKDPYAGTAAAADAYSTCSGTAGRIRHWPVKLWRLDCCGFTLRRQAYQEKDNTTFFDTTVYDHCTYGYLYTWSGYVHGEIYRYGYWYYADISGSANLYCSGM